MPTYGLKYKLEWSGLKNWHSYAIHMSYLGYSGNVYSRNVDASAGAQLTKDNAEVIQSVGLQFGVRCRTEYEFMSFYSPNARNVKVELYQDASVVYTGYLVQNLHNEPYRDPVYPVTLTAVTGLKQLENIDFELTGPQTVLSVLVYLLQQTGNLLNIAICSSLKETSGTDVDYYNAFIDTTVYQGENCLDVLEKLLENFGAKIIQRNNRWFIYHEKDLFTAAPKLFSFSGTYTGTGNLLTLHNMVKYNPETPNMAGAWVNGVMDLSLDEGAKGFDYTFDAGCRDNVFSNGNFQDFDKYNLAKHWDYSGTFKVIIIRTDKSTYHGFNYGTVGEFDVNYDDTISQTLANIQTSAEQYINVSFDVAVDHMSVGATQLRTYGKFVGTSNTYYLKADGTWSSSLVYITTPPANSNIISQFTDEDFTTISVNSIVAPEPGTFTLYLGRAIGQDSEMVDVATIVVYKNIRLFFTDVDKIPYSNLTYVVDDVSNDLFNGDKLQRDFQFADVQAMPANQQIIYAGSIILPNGDVSSQWGTDGISLMQTIANSDLHQKWYGRFILDGKIRSKYLDPLFTFKHNYKLGRAYIFENGSYDLVRETLSGQFYEYSWQNDMFINASAIFCLQSQAYLLNSKGDWATFNPDTGLITFPTLSPDIFDKSNTTWWDASIQTDLHYNASAPREWYITEFNDDLHRYATEATTYQFIWGEYLGINSGVLPLLVFGTALTDALRSIINGALKLKEFIFQESSVLEQDDALIYQANPAEPENYRSIIEMRDEDVIVQEMDFVQQDGVNIVNNNPPHLDNGFNRHELTVPDVIDLASDSIDLENDEITL